MRRGTAPSGTGEHGKEFLRCPISRPVRGRRLGAARRARPRAPAALCWPGAVFPSLWDPAGRRGTEFTPNHNCRLCRQLPAPADALEIALAGLRGPSLTAVGAPYKAARGPGAAASAVLHGQAP